MGLHMSSSVYKAAIAATPTCIQIDSVLQEYTDVASTLCTIRMSIIHIHFPQTETRLHVDDVQCCHINKGC